MSVTPARPQSDLDPFADDVLVGPYEVYRELRDVGPAVYLPCYDLWALMRYEQVREALGDWETYSSYGVALNAPMRELTAVDTNMLVVPPPQHHKLRSILADDLAPRGLRAKIEGLVLICELNGLPEHGRDRFLGWAADMFNAMGPMNPRTERAFASLPEMFTFLLEEAGPDQVKPGSWAATIYAAVDRGLIPGETASQILSTYVAPALDTSINALGWAVKLFAEHPEQWDAVRADEGLVPSAFREVLRLESPVQCFGRRLERDVEISSVQIEAGSEMLLSYASANRDEREWDEPERFDVRRDNVRQLAFGYGVHACIGQGLARLEGHAILTALARRVRRFEIDQPVPLLNNLIHGLDSLPTEISS